MPRSRVTNLAEFRRSLRALSDRARETAAPAAVRAGLAVLADGVRRRAPVGETHELRDSVSSTDPHPIPGGVGGEVVVDSPHAAAVEFGTRHMPAEPFLRPAGDEDGPEALRAMQRALGDHL